MRPPGVALALHSWLLKFATLRVGPAEFRRNGEDRSREWSVTQLTAGRQRLLSLLPTDANQGIYFLANGGATKVDVVGRNKPAELTFMMPAGLTPDDYTLEVRTLFGEEVRAGALGATLTVT